MSFLIWLCVSIDCFVDGENQKLDKLDPMNEPTVITPAQMPIIAHDPGSIFHHLTDFTALFWFFGSFAGIEKKLAI